MKWQRLIFFLVLILSLIYSLNESECKNIQIQAISEWKRHEELIQQFTQVGQTEQGLHLLRDSLACCRKALSLLDVILKDIAGKSKKQRKEPWRVDMKKACKKDKETIDHEINEIQKGVNNVLSSIVFDKAKALYEKSLEKAEEANNKKKSARLALFQILMKLQLLCKRSQGSIGKQRLLLRRPIRLWSRSHPIRRQTKRPFCKSLQT